MQHFTQNNVSTRAAVISARAAACICMLIAHIQHLLSRARRALAVLHLFRFDLHMIQPQLQISAAVQYSMHRCKIHESGAELQFYFNCSDICVSDNWRVLTASTCTCSNFNWSAVGTCTVDLAWKNA
jgi:hypothetical protein